MLFTYWQFCSSTEREELQRCCESAWVRCQGRCSSVWRLPW